MLSLTIRPHSVIHNYLNGAKQISPFKYAVFAVTINYLISVLIYEVDVERVGGVNYKISEIGYYIIQYTFIIILPFINALYLFLSRKKSSNYRYINYLSASIYIVIHALLLFSLSSLLAEGIYFLIGWDLPGTSNAPTISLVILIVYIFWGSGFDAKNILFKYLAIQLLSITSVFIIFFVTLNLYFELGFEKLMIIKNPVIGVYTLMDETEQYIENELSEDEYRQLKVRIDSILPNSPAEKSTLQNGDIIAEIDGFEIDQGLYNYYMGMHIPNDEVELTIRRRSNRFVLRIRLTHLDSISVSRNDSYTIQIQ